MRQTFILHGLKIEARVLAQFSPQMRMKIAATMTEFGRFLHRTGAVKPQAPLFVAQRRVA
jgi:hypothetical protein